MQSHGQIDECIKFAEQSKNYSTVIVHYLNKKDFETALKKICEIENSDQRHKTFLKYAAVLVKKVPEATIFELKSSKFKNIPLKDLVPAFMGVDKKDLEIAFEFISGYCIETRKSREKTVNNLRFYYYVERDNPADLVRFLKQQEEQKNQGRSVYFEVDYALNVCKQKEEELRERIQVLFRSGNKAEREAV